MSLASVVTGKEKKPPRVIIYGGKGIGKTTIAASAKNPIFVPTEDGIGALETARFPLCKTFEDVMSALAVLYREPHSYGTIILDSLDWTEKLVHELVRKEKGENIFAEYGKGFNFSLTHFERMVRGLDALRDHKGMTVILLAHAQIKKFEPPDMDPYDRYKLDLHDKAAALFVEWADVVAFAAYKAYTQTTDGGFGKTVTRATGKGERVLRTEERPSHDGKNRYSLPYELPFKWAELAGRVAASLATVESPKEPQIETTTQEKQENQQDG